MSYINPRAKVLRHLDRLATWARGDVAAPVSVEWDLSNRCVLGCADCHFAHTHTRGPWTARPRALPLAYDSTGDLADLVLVERVLGELTAAGVLGVVWSGGGEPTTHPQWLSAVWCAAGLGLAQGMYTLGGLLTPATARELAALAQWVVVSLDAADAATYAVDKGVPPERFEAACNGVRALADAGGAVVGVSFLLHGGNYRATWAMLDLARQLGATYTTFRPAIRTSPDTPGACADDRAWIADAGPLLAQLAREPDVEVEPGRFRQYADWTGHGYARCLGPRLTTTITPDGRVWICPQRRGVSALGDLRVEPFAALWARHPGHYTVDAGCRVMCRLHPVNETLDALAAPLAHEAFI